ncbi:MAG: hypothetical protein H0V12_08655 [Chloroflexi bacterium]|nr:hypothetical protein [Chloroflexota bacterium]
MHLLSRGWSSPSQQTLYDYGLPRKRCNVGIDSGLDPLAWARMLYRYSPAGYYYDDYTYTSAYSGTRAMINQLYVRNEPAGALVNRGHHAFVLTGATTGCDPSRSACRNSSYTIKTVFINDPWYDRSVNSPGADPDGCAGTGGPYRCGRIGLRPNAAITYSTWATYYFTTWGNQPADCSYWNGKWVAVLRKPDGVAGTPTIAGPAATSYAGVEEPAKDPRFAPDEFAAPGQDASAPAAGPVEVRAASASIAHLDLAFARARLVHELSAQPDFRAALDGARVAGSVRVRSLTSGLPDYLLVPLRSRDGLRGVAMFTLSGGAPTFAGMTYADEPLARFPAVSPEDAAGSLAASGYVVTGAPELVWGWSDESSSPYYPFYRAATDRGLRYVDAYGDVLETIHLRG